jgi:hypothetical protein
VAATIAANPTDDNQRILSAAQYLINLRLHKRWVTSARIGNWKNQLRSTLHLCGAGSTGRIAANGSGRQRLGRFGKAGSLSTPLIVLGKRPKPVGNRLVGHAFGNPEQRTRSAQIFLAHHIKLHKHPLRPDVGSVELPRVHNFGK